MKKIIALLLCCTCIALSGCSVEVGDMESEYEISSFEGTWRQINPNPETYMEAIVDDSIIVINVMQDNGKTSSTYWYGTVPPLTETVSSYQWMSTNDLSKTQYEFLGSPNEKMQILYMNGYLWVPYSLYGVSGIVRLERVEE